MFGRNHIHLNYRYAFNGKEKDVEGMGGGGSTYDYGFRIYNPGIARFLSVDPLSSSYPFYTPYQFAGNKPIMAIDLEGAEPRVIVNEQGKLTESAIKILNVLTGVEIKLLQEVQIMHSKDNKFNAPWYNPNKGGGALTAGDKIYFTENYFAEEGYSTRKYGNASWGGDDGESVFHWIALLAHEVGHLPQADAFGTDKAGVRSYLGYFASGYISRAITLKLPIHDDMPAEIVAELGHKVFEELFITITLNEKGKKQKQITGEGYAFIQAIADGNTEEMDRILNNLDVKITEAIDKYKEEHKKEYKKMDKKLKKANAKKEKRAKKDEKKNE